MNHQIEENRFSRKMFLRFLIPSLTTALFLGFSNIVDSLVIGQRMQEDGLAAVSLTLPLYMILYMLVFGLSTGGSLTFARLLGLGKVKEARNHFSQTELFALAVSLLFVLAGIFLTPQFTWLLGAKPEQGAVYQYTYEYVQILLLAAPSFFLFFTLYEFVRNDNGEVCATVGFAVTTVTAIILSFVFVLVLDFGVRGPIIATVIGHLAGVLIFNTHLRSPSHVLQFTLDRFRIKELRGSFCIGLAGSSRYIMQFVFLYAANRILLQLHGTRGVAVFGLILNVSYIALSVFDGCLATLQPLVATFIGEKSRSSARDVLRRSMLFGLSVTFLLVAAGELFAPFICRGFGITDADVIEAGAYAVRIYLISVLIAGCNTLYGGYAQAAGHERWCWVMTLLRNFAVLMLCMLGFSLTGRLTLFWLMYPVTEIVSLLIWMGAIRYSGSKLLDHTDDERILRTGISGSDDDISRVLQETEAFCEKWEASFKQSYYVTLTVEEICTAILENAFGKSDSAKQRGYIQITLVSMPDGSFELHLRDNARFYNPFDAVTRQISQTDSDEVVATVGILMVKQKAKGFFYRRYLGFNVLVITV